MAAIATDSTAPSEPAGPAEPAPRRPNRRSVLTATGAGLVAAACAPAAPVTAPPKAPATAPSTVPTTTVPTVAPTPRGLAIHLANRASFGATSSAVERIVQIGPAAWLDEQLDPGALAHAEDRLAGYATLQQSNAENDVVRKQDNGRILAELDHATLLRAVYSERQLYEVMCDFWTNHLNVWRGAKWLSQLKTLDNEQVVRTHALGRFADMLMASAKSPAMLVYLDNFASEGQPGKQVNENYGRELLELHTLGILDGVQAFEEHDVVGVAKVLSGWTINWDDGPDKYSFRFGQWAHSHEAVSIFDGAWSRPSRADYHDRVANALADGESLIDFLAHHPSTARHICWKLVRRFVSDQPPPALVDRLTAVYRDNDTAIAPVLRELFLSPEFNASVGQKVKRPVDWLVAALRVARAQIDDTPKGHAASRLRSTTAALGQPLFERVSPDGFPEPATSWVSADGLLKRWEHAAKLARNTLTGGSSAEQVTVDVAALLPDPLPASTGDLVAALASQVCQYDLSTPDRDAICTALQLDTSTPGEALGADTVRLQNLFGLLLAHPSFQRR